MGVLVKLFLLVALGVVVASVCAMAVASAKEALVNSDIIKDRDAIDDAYRRGVWIGQAQVNKYPMGQYTFPIACSHCKNLNSEKCYRCKEERESGFELKVVTNDETDTV